MDASLRVPGGPTTAGTVQNVPRVGPSVIGEGPIVRWNERTHPFGVQFAEIATRYEDTEEEARYAAFILYLDTHDA